MDFLFLTAQERQAAETASGDGAGVGSTLCATVAPRPVPPLDPL